MLSACASVSVGAVHGRRPRAAVHTPTPVGAGASSGTAGSACVTSVAGVKLPACAPFSGGAMLSACASVSVGAVHGRRPRAAVHTPFPVGAGASSGAAGSACATSVAGVKLSACASVSIGAVHGRRPRAAVHAPFPAGAGASSGAAGSACAPFSAGVKLSACASVSVGAVASGGTAAVRAPLFIRRLQQELGLLPARHPPPARRRPPPFRRSRRCAAGRPPDCWRAAGPRDRTGSPSSPAGRRRCTRAAAGAAAPDRPRSHASRMATRRLRSSCCGVAPSIRSARPYASARRSSSGRSHRMHNSAAVCEKPRRSARSPASSSSRMAAAVWRCIARCSVDCQSLFSMPVPPFPNVRSQPPTPGK